MTDRPSGGMTALLALRFLAELGLLAELAWAGWRLPENAALGIVLAVALPTVAALAWGRWVAPRAGHRLPDPGRAGVELVLFAGAFVLVTFADADTVGWALALLAVYLISIPSRRVEL